MKGFGALTVFNRIGGSQRFETGLSVMNERQ